MDDESLAKFITLNLLRDFQAINNKYLSLMGDDDLRPIHE